MEAKAKDRLHHLVDELPANEVRPAERYLEYLRDQGAPLLRALADAPESDEPLSDEDREALEEGRRALDEGDVVSDEKLREELGI